MMITTGFLILMKRFGKVIDGYTWDAKVFRDFNGILNGILVSRLPILKLRANLDSMTRTRILRITVEIFDMLCQETFDRRVPVYDSDRGEVNEAFTMYFLPTVREFHNSQC